MFWKKSQEESPRSWLLLPWGWRKATPACSCDPFVQKQGREVMPTGEDGQATGLQDGHRVEGSGPRMLCYLAVLCEGGSISLEPSGCPCVYLSCPGDDTLILVASEPLSLSVELLRSATFPFIEEPVRTEHRAFSKMLPEKQTMSFLS